MANPVSFEFSNQMQLSSRGSPQIPFFTTHIDDDPKTMVTISCWELTDEEVEELKRTKRIWLTIHGNHPPVDVCGRYPF